MAEQTQKQQQMQRVQGLMVFLGSLANGLELLLGRGSDSISFRAGRTVGLEWPTEHKEPDVLKALDAVYAEMKKIGIDWPFEPWKKDSDSAYVVEQDGEVSVKLAFRNCLVRCTLFRYGFPQEMTLCQTNHGLFCGLFEKITGVKGARIDIIHSGENACLLKLVYHK